MKVKPRKWLERERKVELNCEIFQSVCCFHFSTRTKEEKNFQAKENFPVTHLEMFFCFLAAVCHIITEEQEEDHWKLGEGKETWKRSVNRSLIKLTSTSETSKWQVTKYDDEVSLWWLILQNICKVHTTAHLIKNCGYLDFPLELHDRSHVGCQAFLKGYPKGLNNLLHKSF